MEPTDIDKIITNKLQESNDLHQHEMDTAKPFVWSAVQNKIGRKRSLTWVHLAAAVVLLLITFSFFFNSAQRGHKKELSLLSDKIDQLQINYSYQGELLGSKDNQIHTLHDELKNIELQLVDLQQQKPLSAKETIVYRTDTVYLTQVEYITAVSEPVEAEEVPPGTSEDQVEQIIKTTVKEKGTDAAIYPSNSIQAKNQQSETLKFKFGSFVARKD